MYKQYIRQFIVMRINEKHKSNQGLDLKHHKKNKIKKQNKENILNKKTNEILIYTNINWNFVPLKSCKSKNDCMSIPDNN